MKRIGDDVLNGRSVRWKFFFQVSDFVVMSIFDSVQRLDIEITKMDGGSELLLLFVWSIGWFVWFYGTSTFVGYLTPNPVLCK